MYCTVLLTTLEQTSHQHIFISISLHHHCRWVQDEGSGGGEVHAWRRGPSERTQPGEPGEIDFLTCSYYSVLCCAHIASGTEDCFQLKRCKVKLCVCAAHACADLYGMLEMENSDTFFPLSQTLVYRYYFVSGSLYRCLYIPILKYKYFSWCFVKWIKITTIIQAVFFSKRFN